ncbi:MAG: hypothetical protein IJ499_07020 [Clostridia bacterium]|nr:hypothetical protein [Clostridia bacterium]
MSDFNEKNFDFDYDFDEEFDPVLEGLLEMVRKCPKPDMYILNFKRFAEAIKSSVQIVNAMKENSSELSVRYFYDPIIGTALCIEICAQIIGVVNMKSFAEALSAAETFGIDAKLDGSVSVGITYQNVRIPVRTKE